MKKDDAVFVPVFTGYLNMKGFDGDIDELIGFVLSEEIDFIDDSRGSVEALNMLLYKDIVEGLWSEKLTVEAALYQIVNAVDLMLALKGFLFATVDEKKVHNSFKSIANKIDAIEDEEDYQLLMDLLMTDQTWIPVQKEYRNVYTFLLANMISLLFRNESFEDF